MSNIRIFVNCELLIENEIKIEDKTFNYLANVMRVEVGDEVKLIDGINGEFLSFVKSVNKKYLIIFINITPIINILNYNYFISIHKLSV